MVYLSGSYHLFLVILGFLEFLLRHPGKTFSRADLLKEVWGFDVAPSTRTVDTHVFNLRKKLENKEGKLPPIVTVRGYGYRYERHSNN